MRIKKLLACVLALVLGLSTLSALAACNKGEEDVFKLDKTTLTLTVGESATLTLTTNLTGTAEWESSAPAVATVSGGTVTGVAEGSATVTASLGGKTASCAVEVKAEEGGSGEDFTAVVDGEVNFSYFADLQPLETIDSVSYDFGVNKHSQSGEEAFGELVTLSVMQGLLARREGNTAGIYLNIQEGGINSEASDTWLNDLVEFSGAELNVVEDTVESSAFRQMLEKYKSAVTQTQNGKPGYVLFEQELTDAVDQDGNAIQTGKEEVNAACTVSAATGYLAVDVTSEELVKELGYELAVDVRGWSEKQAYEAYSDDLNADVIMLSNNGQAQNRDLGVALGTYFMYQSNQDSAFMNQITHPTTGKYKQGTLTVGWSSTGEVDQVNRHAMYGFNFTCTNYSYNLSQMTRLGDTCFRQKDVDKKITADPTKKYVTFIMTDGDNITWHQNDFVFADSWYGYEGRGEFAMGWTMAPLMADIAPIVVQREYESATDRDQFVCGVSGAGYVYPSEYLNTMQEDALTKLVEATNEYMRRTDLDYVEILDNVSFNSQVMNAYASQPDIDGGFMLQNGVVGYKQGGDIRYYNGKPFIGIGEGMWSDTPGRVAHRLNSLPVDITSANGYTVVKVHCWTTSMEDVARVVSLLDDNIEIVTPGEMMQLVKDNVKTDSKRTAVADTNYPPDVDEYVDAQYFWDTLEVNSKTEFNFDTYLDYEGWEKHIGSKTYDYVSFSGEAWTYSTAVRTTVDGGDGYSIRLDGSDYGNLDTNPNSSIYSKLHVPDSAQARFSFFIRGEAYGYDADFRVRVITNATGTPTIELLGSDWSAAGDDQWREVVYDVSAYRGQDVIFIIEQNSTQREGDGEILYVDGIKIGTETVDLNTVKGASVNANTTLDFASDAQGFQIIGSGAYSSARQALEATVGAQQPADDGADAVFYTKFDLKDISGYTHHKFGVWACAEEGKTAQVRLAVVSADGKAILRGGVWQEITDEPSYLCYEQDTIRLTGGAFRYANVMIEVRGNGEDAKVYLDNAAFAKMTRSIDDGYYYDAEYFKTMQISQLSSLNELSGWNYQSGRGLEDEALVKDGIARLYGYDFMKGSDTSIVSKALGGYAKVANEFNARMYAKIDVGSASELTFTVARIQKTPTNLDTVIPQIRVLFVGDDGQVSVLSAWQDIGSFAETQITADLTSVQNKTGVLMIEMDCSQNGGRAGVNVSSVSVA